MKRLILPVSLMIIVSLLAACAGATPTAQPAQQPTQAPVQAATPVPQPTVDKEAAKYGGTLVLPVAGIVQFDYAQSADDASFYVISLVNVMLFRNTVNGIYGDLATSWKYENDTTLIMSLRKGVMFQDDNVAFPKGQSREVVADDVVYSIKRGVEMKDSKISSDLLTAYKAVEAVDKYTVKLTLKAPNALLLTPGRGLSYIAVVPHEAVEKLGDKYGLNPIGAGPFKFSEYKPDESVTLVRNDLYWKKPYLDKVVFKVIPDPDAQLIALEKGEIDYLPIGTPNVYDRVKKNSKLALTPVQLECAPWIMFNMSHPLFSQKEFRQAFAYAIDGQGISKNIRGGLFTGGCGISGKGVPGYDPNLCQYFPYKPDEAKAILLKAGFTYNKDNMLEKGGKLAEFELEIWNMGDTPQFGEALVTQLKAAGFPVKLQTVEFGTWINDMMGGANKAFMASGFCTDGGLNGVFGRDAATSKAMKYNTPEVFDLLDKANVTVDPVERDKILRTAQEKLFSEYMAFPFGHCTGFQALNPRVNDFSGLFWTANVTTEKNNVWVTK